MKESWWRMFGVIVVMAGLGSCTSYQQQGGLLGGLAGAAAGAAFGDDHQDVVAGAAVGAAVGAGAAAIHEDSVRRRDYDRYGIPPQERQGPPPPPQNRPPTNPRGDYPTARPAGVPNQVFSPYEPYGKVDVTGFRSGQLARDPKSGKIFRVP